MSHRGVYILLQEGSTPIGTEAVGCIPALWADSTLSHFTVTADHAPPNRAPPRWGGPPGRLIRPGQSPAATWFVVSASSRSIRPRRSPTLPFHRQDANTTHSPAGCRCHTRVFARLWRGFPVRARWPGSGSARRGSGCRPSMPCPRRRTS